jgi:ribonucleoside-diphosphate reductase alpha chain
MDVVGTCVSMALQYGVPLITLVDKFRHARFEPAGMTSNKNIPFAKSLIDYIFCWMGCEFIPGYVEKNTPNRSEGNPPENKTTTTAKTLVEKTKDLAKKIAEAKAAQAKPQIKPVELQNPAVGKGEKSRFAEFANRAVAMVTSVVKGDSDIQAETAAMQQFNAQFEHFQDDAPVCDICGAITVRNGSCYKCYNCGNSMGCS